MTIDSQNKGFHLVNHQMADSRVSGAMLDSSAPKVDLIDVCNLTFYQWGIKNIRGLTTLSRVPVLITLMF